MIFVILILALLIIAGIVVLIVLLAKKNSGNKANQTQYQQQPAQDNFTYAPSPTAETEKTTFAFGSGPVIDPSEKIHRIKLIDAEGQHAPLFAKVTEHVIVGGDIAGGCDVIIDYDESINDRHCKITRENEDYYIEDLGTMLGTCVNGRQIDTEVEIHSGDMIKLGNSTFKFEIVD